MKFKRSETKVSTSQNVSTSRNAQEGGGGGGRVSSTPNLRVGLCWCRCGCRYYSVQSHYLTWFAITRHTSRTSLPDRCRLVRFLGEWLWDWTGAFFGNGAIKERLIYTYIEHHFKMVERSIGEAPDSHC